jgi:hypothetical protein
MGTMKAHYGTFWWLCRHFSIRRAILEKYGAARASIVWKGREVVTGNGNRREHMSVLGNDDDILTSSKDY